jgi:hypothetical protein
MNEEPSWSLADPRPIAQSARYTFFLPGPREVAAIGVDDDVKLIFGYHHPTETWGAERMWVTVTRVEGDTLFGNLANVPDEPTSPLTLGQAVVFARSHVLAINWAHPDTAPPSSVYRQYWDRCLVDASVVEGETPVEFLYREEPDMAQDDDKFPDSGWRIRGRMDDATDEGDAPLYVALGAVLNQDDSWLHLIDAPVGSAFMRDFETDRYRPE